VFEVIHPFHPLYGQRFEVVEWRCNWGEQRLYYHDLSGRLTSLPIAWTSFGPVDPVVCLGEGRAYFRAADLSELAGRLKEIS
jgi:hypothetical protein